MKKQVLFSIAVGVCISAAAQSQLKAVKQNTSNLTNKNENASASFGQSILKPVKAGAPRATSKTYMSASRNAFGLLVSESSAMTANQATNTILMNHRISPDWSPAGVNSGFIQATFTTDNGVTWDSLLQVQQASPNLCRYPSGAIFNPAGNTVPANAFVLVSGPITDGSGWQGNYFANTQLNNTNNTQNILLNTTPGVAKQDFARIATQATDNKVIVTAGLYTDANGTTAATQLYRGAAINIATPSGSTFNWAVDSIKPNFMLDPVDGSNQTYTQAMSAWSQDGTTGYITFVGIDAAATGAELSYQPIVYKTTDGGVTYSKLPLFDFSSLPAINANLIPSTGGTQKAFYSQSSGIDATVDANGNLHIVNVVLSGASDAADSLGYTWSPTATNPTAYIYDTYTTAGGWGAMLVDSLKTITADANSPFTNGTAKLTVDSRIQVSRSTDGTHIFYLWMDSDPTAAGGENAVPDIFGKGLNITTGGITPTTQFTFDGGNYYMYASNITLVNGTTYSIPSSVSTSRDGSGDGLMPFNHYYVSGVQFNEADFVVATGINENTNAALSFSLFPNPAGANTSLTFTAANKGNVSIKVYDVTGQLVSVVTNQDYAAGSYSINLNVEKLNSGIYFVNMTTANGTASKKMIIK